MMIYEAIAGERPFTSETTYGLLYQHVESEPPRPRVRGPYTQALSALAMRCLAKNANERPAMAEVAERLDEATLRAPFARWKLAGAAAAITATLFAAIVVYPRLID